VSCARAGGRRVAVAAARRAYLPACSAQRRTCSPARRTRDEVTRRRRSRGQRPTTPSPATASTRHRPAVPRRAPGPPLIAAGAIPCRARAHQPLLANRSLLFLALLPR
jgi:hypothetical protein